MATLFPQLDSSLDLEVGFTPSMKPNFLLVQKLDCYSWRSVQCKIFMYAFPRPWVGLMHQRLLSHPLFKRICLAFPCFTLREAYRHYIPVSREFTRLGLLAFLWINLNKDNMNTKNSHNIMYIA